MGRGVNALRFQLLFITNALKEVSNDTNDLVARREVLSLVKEFLVMNLFKYNYLVWHVNGNEYHKQ